MCGSYDITITKVSNFVSFEDEMAWKLISNLSCDDLLHPAQGKAQ